MPRKRRIRQRSRSAPAVLEPRRPAKRRQWTNEAMEAAIAAVKRGESVLRAASGHGVPRTTLQDRVKGRVKHGSNPGPKRYLTAAEEGELAGFLVETAKIGYGKTRKEVKSIAESVAREKGELRGEKISEGWFRGFLKRQPKLSLRRGDPTANVRMDSLDEDTKKDYFNVLEDTLKEHNLIDSPGQIYNVDETGVPLDHKPPNVIVRKGQKKVRYRITGKKKQITVVGCVNAAGNTMPPFVIFDAKHLNHDWTDGEVPGTTYGLSSNGWIDSELFHGWLVDHFLKHAVSARPLLLLLDGHSSHYNPETIRYAKDHNVIVLCLPPHTTHDSQPLDTCVFGPLKRHWMDVCHTFMQKHPGQLVTKYQFSKLFKEAWMKAMIPANIISGFRKCGVYPFNPDALAVTQPSVPQPPENVTKNVNGDQAAASAGSSKQNEGSDSNLEKEDDPVFSPEEQRKNESRYEDGYNVPNDRYLLWLKLNHPDDVQDYVSGTTSLLDSFSDVAPLVSLPVEPLPMLHVSPSMSSSGAVTITPTPPSASSSGAVAVPPVLPSASSGAAIVTPTPPSASSSGAVTVPPVLPSASSGAATVTPTPPSASPSGAVAISPVLPSASSGAAIVTPTPPSASSSGIAPAPLVPPSPSSLGSPTESSGTPSAPLSASSRAPGSELKFISKYLVQYVPTPKRASTTRKVGGFRVLTSAKSLAALKEIEDKKKEVAKQKAQRKKEMEEKRKQKEEIKRKKAEEKEAKAKERASRQKKTSAKRSQQPTKRKQPTAPKPPAKALRVEPAGDDTSTSNVVTRSSKGKSASTEVTETIDVNLCYICFQTYDGSDEDAGDWIECTCGRWVHEDCVDYDIVVDASGRERICPYCVL